MEIGIQLLAPLLTGSSVSLCADNRLVRIVRADHTSVFDVSCTPVKELKREPQNVSFAEWLDVPKDSDYRGLLARFEIKLSEFDENHLRYIRRGLHYSTNLDIGAIDVPGVGESRQVQAVMSYVLREASGRAWLLGFVDLAPPSRLDKDEGVVAVLDILGFSALMRSESLDEVEFKVRNGILAMLSVIRSTSGGVVLFEKHGDLDLSDDIALVSSGVISDTIILYPNRQSHAEPVTLLCEAVSHVMSFGLQLGWLLRGAISIGSFRAIPDEAIYLGTAIVSAHDLETAQEWSGCALSRELVERFPQEIAALLEKGAIVRFTPPMKESSRTRPSEFSVNWFLYEGAFGRESPEDRLSQLFNAAPDTARVKIQNTVAFLAHMRKTNQVGKQGWTVTGLNEE